MSSGIIIVYVVIEQIAKCALIHVCMMQVALHVLVQV